LELRSSSVHAQLPTSHPSSHPHLFPLKVDIPISPSPCNTKPIPFLNILHLHPRHIRLLPPKLPDPIYSIHALHQTQHRQNQPNWENPNFLHLRLIARFPLYLPCRTVRARGNKVAGEDEKGRQMNTLERLIRIKCSNIISEAFGSVIKAMGGRAAKGGGKSLDFHRI
jgi:hypothetical protein